MRLGRKFSTRADDQGLSSVSLKVPKSESLKLNNWSAISVCCFDPCFWTLRIRDFSTDFAAPVLIEFAPPSSTEPVAASFYCSSVRPFVRSSVLIILEQVNRRTDELTNRHRTSETTADGSHLFPSRTEKLSRSAPMVLHG